MVKNLPPMRETWVRSLDWEDTLEEGMATHSSIPAWRSPRTEEPAGLQSMGLQRVGQDWATKHRAGIGPGVGPGEWLSWSVHPLGSALCRVYAQYPAFAPSTLILLGVLVFLCLLFIICPK